MIVQKLALVVDGRPDEELDLTRGLEEIKKTKFSLKEGVQFKIRIDFIVQREIVTGLKYVQKTSRMGVNGKNLLVSGLLEDKILEPCDRFSGQDDPHGRFIRSQAHCSELPDPSGGRALWIHGTRDIPCGVPFHGRRQA